MNIFVKIVLGAAAVVGAQGMLWMDKAFAAETGRTVAVYQDNDKRMALNFISEELRLLGNDGGPAIDEYIELQEDIMAGEATRSAVRHLAASYKKRHPEESAFEAAFTPTHRLIFERDGIWHAVDMASSLKVDERCYTRLGATTQCP